MSRYIDPQTDDKPSASRTAVLLVNLGTPKAPTPDAVREYLAEFLSDPRVVELPRALWWPVLHGYVLRTRPRRVSHPRRRAVSLHSRNECLARARDRVDAIGDEASARLVSPRV
ncbi:MAG: hypothetical protein C4338_06240 [Rhodanobacteraceae bacterium]